MTRLSWLLIAALLVAPACGQPSLDEEITALQQRYDKGDLSGVVATAPALLERAGSEGAGDAKAWRIEKLRLQALARQGKAEEALADLQRLDDSRPGKVDAALYLQVTQLVSDGGKLTEAVTVLHAGAERFPEAKEKFDVLAQQFAARAASEGDSEATAKLKALGYL